MILKQAAVADVGKWARRRATLLVALMFFPYPALPITGHAGLQIWQLLLPVLWPWRAVSRRNALAISAWFIPSLVSAGILLLSDSSDAGLKAAAIEAIFLLPLLLFSAIPGDCWLRVAIAGSSIAIFAQVVFGAYQLVSFRSGKFPLLGLFINPSFADLQSGAAQQIAQFSKRVFGLMPEPSAMSASLGPWTLLLLGLAVTGQAGRLGRAYQYSAATSAILGQALILVSGSGFNLFIAVSDAVLLAYILRRKPVLGLAVGAIAGCVLLAVWDVLSPALPLDRLTGENESWVGRLGSIRVGMDMWLNSAQSFLFGVGPGQTSVQFPAFLRGDYFVGALGFVPRDVISVLFMHIAEDGLMGLVGAIVMLGLAVNAISRAAREMRLPLSLALGGLIYAWAVTTSYVPLAPAWLILGFLIAWSSRGRNLEESREGAENAGPARN